MVASETGLRWGVKAPVLIVGQQGRGLAVFVGGEADPVGGEGIGKLVDQRLVGGDVEGIKLDPVAGTTDIDFDRYLYVRISGKRQRLLVIGGHQIGIG
jgi:hypothetical protein